MFDWIESVAVWFVTIAVAFAAGLFTAFLEPVQRFAARLGRTVIRASPVRVHVETRLDVIWAGDPMAWIAHEFYLPGGVEGLPAGTLAEWQEWIGKRGGCDHRMTLVMITLTSDASVPVIMRPPIPTVQSAPIESGQYILRPALGGADIYPEAFELDLQSGSLVGDEFSLRGPLSWTLEPGSGVQQVLVRAFANGEDLYSWTLRLPLIVDGRDVDIVVDDNGKPFRTAGTSAGLPSRRLVYGSWEDLPAL